MSPLAYRRALALARACDLDWARFALGLTVTECTCDPNDWFGMNVLGHARLERSASCLRHNPQPLPVPARIDDLHASYIEDCKRREVETGPMPSLKWRFVPPCEFPRPVVQWTVERMFSFAVDSSGPSDASVKIWVGVLEASVGPSGVVRVGTSAGFGVSSAADLARLSSLVTAVCEVST